MKQEYILVISLLYVGFMCIFCEIYFSMHQTFLSDTNKNFLSISAKFRPIKRCLHIRLSRLFLLKKNICPTDHIEATVKVCSYLGQGWVVLATLAKLVHY